MKNKKIYVIGLILVVVIVYWGLRYIGNKYFQESQIKVDTTGNVEMVILEESITNEGVSFYISNKNSYPVYANDFEYLEVFRFGKWYNLPTKKGVFSSNLLEEWISIGENSEFSINWIGDYGELGGGKYRIVKPIFYTRDYERYGYVVAEFTIYKGGK